MTYYLWKGMENEVAARVEYLKRVFHTCFIRCADKGDFICLKSFPFKDDGVCFVTGHNSHAHALLSNGLQEKTIVLNCCFPKQFSEFTTNHRIYFCRVDEQGFARFRRASEFATGFDILDSELLLLYSDKTDVMDKVRDAYVLIGGRK